MITTTKGYAVERIVNMVPGSGEAGDRYKVKWLEFSEEHNSFLPPSSLKRVVDLINDDCRRTLNFFPSQT
jgi:hypothetical protein